MTKSVLITTGNGMFGRALINELAGDSDIDVRGMIREGRTLKSEAPNLSAVVADMDDPGSLKAAVAGASHVFLVSPMDERITERECSVIDAAVATGTNPHVLKLYGAVEHRSDHLDTMHQRSIEHLKASGLPWTLVSPNSVMETSFLWLAQTIAMNAIFGTSGRGKVGFVAVGDVARVAGDVIRRDLAVGENLRLTGPAALDLYEVADAFTAQLGRQINYYDMTDDDLAEMMLNWGAFPDRATVEINVLCHFRAWGRGDAALVTDTFREVVGTEPTSVAEWISRNAAAFSRPQTGADRQAAAGLARQFGRE